MSSSVRNTLLSIGLLGALCGGALAREPSLPALPVQILPDELQWQTNAKLHGLETATLAGDPKAAAPYAERIRFPPNFRLAPHAHPNQARMVTVLSGTLYYAFGDRFDETRLRALPPGSFFTEPPDLPHYALTRDEPVVLELHAIGPAATKYVETEDAAGRP